MTHHNIWKKCSLSAAIMLCSVLSVTSRRSDERWLQHPYSHIILVDGQHLLLTYKYVRPPSSPRPGKLFFGRRTPADGPETNLMEADVDPDTGDMTVVYTREQNKVNITYYKEGFEITVYNMSHSETGLYLTDLNYDLDAALHDSFTVMVFNAPTLICSHGRTIGSTVHANVTLRWNLEEMPDLPRVTNVTILSLPVNTNGSPVYLISHSLDPETDQWQLMYHSGKHLPTDRISYAAGPKHQQFQLTLWDLEVNDSADYQFILGFESNVTTVNNTVYLQVMPDYNWKSSPQEHEYVISSRDISFNFIVGVLKATDIFEHLEFVKCYPDGRNQVILTITITNRVNTAIYKEFLDKWRAGYDVHGRGVLVSLRKADDSDSGTYVAKVKGHSGYILLEKVFQLHVVDERWLEPIIIQETSLDNPETRTVRINVNSSILYVDVAVTSLTENHVNTYVEARIMHSINITVPSSVRAINVSVEYDRLNYRIFKTLTLSTVFARCSDAYDACTGCLYWRILVILNVLIVLIVTVTLIIVITWRRRWLRDHSRPSQVVPGERESETSLMEAEVPATRSLRVGRDAPPHWIRHRPPGHAVYRAELRWKNPKAPR